jgi:chloramphenicol O-acetyltransferase type A
MHQIDLAAWPRREHYELFGSFNHPHVALCANVDVTALRAHARQHGLSFNTSVIYLLGRVANGIPAFRQRIRDGQVVEHDRVDPSYTILVRDDLFTFCTIEYTDDFQLFARRAASAKESMRAQASLAAGLEGESGRDDLLYISVIPWVSFTSFQHPMPFHPTDSVPRFAVGKFFQEGESWKMPLSVQGHHALVDGLHIGRFYLNMQEYLARPDAALKA